LTQLTQKEIKPLREKLLKENEFKCPLCENHLDESESALDHCHTSGQIRGTICKRCNSLEGIFRSRWIRSGVAKKVDFTVYMINLSKYLQQDHYPLLHPSHAPRPRKLMKQSYNQLKREIEDCNHFLKRPIKVPPYPKSKRLTKKLKELFEQFGMFPRFYNN
jgi:hypothetical protein